MNLAEKEEEIFLLMKYAAAGEDLPAARDLVARHKNDHISLNIFHEFYSYLPEAQNDVIRALRLLWKREGNFLIAVTTTIDNYLYITSHEGSEYLGRHEDGIWDKEVLELFDLDHGTALEKFKDLNSFPLYVPANMDLRLCPVCATDHGDLHRLGCPVEICPWCGGQLAKCNCRFEQTGKEVLKNEAQLKTFIARLNTKGRIPFNATEQSLTLG
ncbi:MAG: hypothetical protein GXP59_08965 [Deltaproteobacteria bacterium]|nr:hypothetical protein [Deltaproteobacteria bacterium]